MDLWRQTHRRCHPDPNATAPIALSTEWPKGFERNSVQISDDTFSDTPPTADDNTDVVEGFVLVDEQEIGERNENDTVNSVSKGGIDAVALYAPVHFFGPEKWGIYIHERRFYGLCSALRKQIGSRRVKWNGLVADLDKAINQHEYFHAAVEIFGLTFEDISGPLDAGCAYGSYFDGIYKKFFPTSDCIEESLATASEFSCRYATPGFKNALANITETMPEAYADWHFYGDATKFFHGKQALAKGIRLKAEEINRRNGEAIGLWPSLTYAQLRSAQQPTENVWFPETRPRTLNRFGPVPRWIYRSGGVTSGRTFRKQIGTIKMSVFLRALKKKLSASWEPGGKEMRIHIPNVGRFSYSKSASEAPEYLIKEIASKLGKPWRNLLRELELA